MPLNNYDVIILGAGSMGISTAYWLAKGGYKVLGLDQFDIPHELGAHTGQSRIIRKAYFEHPDYVPLLNRAYKNWKEFETLTSKQLYFKTGLVYFGQSNNAVIKGVKESADLHQIEIEQLSREQRTSTFPQFTLPENFETIYEPDAGFITPEKAIQLYKDEAIKSGADIRTNEIVLSWKKEDDIIKIISNKNTYYSKKLIITAGAWMSKLLPQLKPGGKLVIPVGEGKVQKMLRINKRENLEVDIEEFADFSFVPMLEGKNS